MENQIKVLQFIRTKQKLVELFIDQMPENEIRYEMNLIIKSNNMSIKRHLITDKMALTFIKKFGTPRGFILSDELQLKLKEL
jgi:hypothetical protein